MSEATILDTSEAMKEFMIERGWHEHTCSACSRIFFSKSSTKMDVSVCGWHKCDSGTYPFRTYAKRKKCSHPNKSAQK
jgi:hypothetical protein